MYSKDLELVEVYAGLYWMTATFITGSRLSDKLSP